MKKLIFFIALILAFSVLFVSCNKSSQDDETKNDETKNNENLQEEVDYSEYPFVGVWERDAENDIETIRFGADGSFAYYCACGNPVNDSDLCEGYTYDDETKTITFNCLDTSDEMVTSVVVVECDDTSLTLDFDGELRVFTK